MLARIDGDHFAVAPLDVQRRVVDRADRADRPVEQSGLADRLPNHDALADRVRRLAVDRLERDVGAGELPHRAPLVASKGVERDPLAIGECLNAAFDAPAFDRTPTRSAPRAPRLGNRSHARTALPVGADCIGNVAAPNRLRRFALPELTLPARLFEIDRILTLAISR